MKNINFYIFNCYLKKIKRNKNKKYLKIIAKKKLF